MKKISVIIPTYCEEDVINEFYSELKKVLIELEKYEYEMIFINDGSTDKTETMLNKIASNDKNVKIISFSRNFGHQPAITAGIRQAKGDLCVIIDADLQDPPEIILQMLSKWENGYEVVYGRRKKRKGENILKKITAKIFYYILSKLSDIEIPKDVGDFRLVDKKVIDIIKELPERSKFYRGLFSWGGFNQTFIDYDRDKRYAGKTKYSLIKMIKLALDGVISFSNKPIKLIGKLGILAIIVSVIIFIYALVSFIYFKDTTIAGWTSLICAVVFFSGVQLISIWILSEYIGRIYIEVKKRPEYVIKHMINMDKNNENER